MPNLDTINSYWIKYNGTYNYDLNTEHASVTVRSPIAIPSPERKFKKFSAPGRNGDLIFPTDAYENMSLSVDLFIYTDEPRAHLLSQMAHSVMEWLTSASGYADLEIYDNYGRYSAFYTGPSSVENDLYRFGRATITFDLMPQNYINEEQFLVYNAPAASATRTIAGEGGQFAEPTIVIPLSVLREESSPHVNVYENPTVHVDIRADDINYPDQLKLQKHYSAYFSFEQFGLANNVPPAGQLVIHSRDKRVFISTYATDYIWPYTQHENRSDTEMTEGVHIISSSPTLRWPVLNGRHDSYVTITYGSDNVHNMPDVNNIMIQQGWWRV